MRKQKQKKKYSACFFILCSNNLLWSIAYSNRSPLKKNPNQNDTDRTLSQKRTQCSGNSHSVISGPAETKWACCPASPPEQKTKIKKPREYAIISYVFQHYFCDWFLTLIDTGFCRWWLNSAFFGQNRSYLLNFIKTYQICFLVKVEITCRYRRVD